METFLLIPLEDTVVFPNMNVTLPVDVGDEEQVLLVPTHEGEYAKVGVVAEVEEKARLPRAVTAGYSPELSFEQKVQLLEQLDVVERLTLALGFQRESLAQAQVRQRIRD